MSLKSMARAGSALALAFALQACAAGSPPPAPPASTYDYGQFSRAMAAYRLADYRTAFDEFRPLAENGMAAAQFRLGLLYENGRGVTEDLDAAEAWYERAAAQGYAEAFYNLGYVRYVRDDVADAVQWWTRAARRGNADAMYGLGLLYDEGGKAAGDLVQAHMWFDLAASSGALGAAAKRDAVAARLSAAELAEARARAAAWGDGL